MRILASHFRDRAALMVITLAAATPLWAQNVANYQELPDPLLFLIREAAVLDDLQLTQAQRTQLLQWNQQWDPLLLSSRQLAAEDAARVTREVLQQTREKMATLLDEPQRLRLGQIAYRLRGISFVLAPAARQQLQLSPGQITAIEAQTAETAQQLRELRQQLVGAAVPQSEAESRATAMRREEQLQILQQLTPPQKEALIEMVGADFDLSRLGHVTFQAPELPGSGLWMQSPPLQLRQLRGRVVVVHFFAFECLNCIRNYPHYLQWQSQFSDREVTIIGVHTPETETERDPAQLRAKLDQHGLRFPVVADNDQAIWKAWGNTMWPSVYLIDKQGRLRYWWYGELDWQGAGGHKLMAERIEQLLRD